MKPGAAAASQESEDLISEVAGRRTVAIDQEKPGAAF